MPSYCLGGTAAALLGRGSVRPSAPTKGLGSASRCAWLLLWAAEQERGSPSRFLAACEARKDTIPRALGPKRFCSCIDFKKKGAVGSGCQRAVPHRLPAPQHTTSIWGPTRSFQPSVMAQPGGTRVCLLWQPPPAVPILCPAFPHICKSRSMRALTDGGL